MRIEPTPIAGCHVVRPQRHTDARGAFARAWDGAAFAAAGLRVDLDQVSVSHNTVRGTLRGMHLQRAPHAEAKLVRCTRGAVWDVCLDLRPDSPTRGRWHAERLDPDNGLALYVPEGCAHGFLTLTDASDVLYLIAGRYEPAAAWGVRWNDPAFGIAWPSTPSVIHARDAAYPDWSGEARV